MHDIAITVFGLAGLLALVSFLPPLANRLSLPYTVLLAAVGCALSGVTALLHDGAGSGIAGDFVEALKGFDISAEIFLYVFLPALLFEGGLAIDVRRLMDDVAPILLMAVVAVLVCTVVVGIALSPFAEVGLPACLLLGAIVATTDPAAVISIFRDLGAPRRLSILVEGESIFNDAAAIALFGLLLGLLTGEREGGGLFDTAGDFAVSFLGGGIVGLLAGRLTCAVVGALRGLRAAEITLTVALAYTAYVIADRYLGVSGVVAVVVAALVAGSVGRTRISPSTWDSLRETWEQLAFWANSLVFILAAMLVPRLLVDIGWNDGLLLAVLVLASLAARAVVLWGLLPPLALLRPASRVSGPYKLVMLWGGLRGAVSLALALAVTEHQALSPEVRHFVAVLTTGFVLFTLFVQGLTLRPLIRALGLDRLSPAERAVRDRALKLARSEIRERIESLAKRDNIAANAVAEVSREIEKRSAALDAAPAAALSEDDRVYIGLATLATREYELALERFQERLFARKIAVALMAQSGRLLDGVKTGGRAGYEAAAQNALAFPRDFRAAQLLHRRFGVVVALADKLADRYETLLVSQVVLRALVQFNESRLRPLLGSSTGDILAGILATRAAAIDQALAALHLQYPEYFAALQQRYLGRVALRLEEDTYRAMLAESVVSQEVFNDLDRGIAQRWRVLDRRPPLDIAMKPEEMIARVPLFASLEPARLADIARLLTSRFVTPGERVITQGERGDAMYFIESGAAEVRLPQGRVRLGSGDFFGEIALVTHQPRIADVVALSYCRLLMLNATDFGTLLQADPELRRIIAGTVRQRLGQPAQAV